MIVRGKNVTIKVNDKVMVEYTEPDNVERPADMAGRQISSGTFALQGHDPKSKVFTKHHGEAAPVARALIHQPPNPARRAKTFRAACRTSPEKPFRQSSPPRARHRLLHVQS